MLDDGWPLFVMMDGETGRANVVYMMELASCRYGD